MNNSEELWAIGETTGLSCKDLLLVSIIIHNANESYLTAWSKANRFFWLFSGVEYLFLAAKLGRAKILLALYRLETSNRVPQNHCHTLLGQLLAKGHKSMAAGQSLRELLGQAILFLSRPFIVVAALGLVPAWGYLGDLNFFFELCRSFAHFYLLPLALSLLLLTFLVKKNGEVWCLLILGLISFIVYSSDLRDLYTPPQLKQQAGPAFKILSLNQHNNNTDSSACRRLINKHQPDIIGITEATPDFLRNLELSEQYAQKYEQPTRDCSGLALYHNFPLVSSHPLHFKNSFPGLLQIIMLPEKRESCLYLVHAPPPQGDLSLRKRAHFINELRRHQQQYCSGRPTIIMGDFNFTPFSSAYSKLKKEPLNLKNAAQGRGFQATWPQDQIPLLNTIIDYIFHSAELCVKRLEVGHLAGSDHAPLFAELAFCRADALARRPYH